MLHSASPIPFPSPHLGSYRNQHYSPQPPSEHPPAHTRTPAGTHQDRNQHHSPQPSPQQQPTRKEDHNKAEKGKSGLITQSESSWQEVGPLDQRPNHRHMEWRRRRCRATSGPPMWSRSSVRRCESGGIPRIAPHSRRSKSLRLHDRPGNGQRSPGDGPFASDERCSSTCRSQ